MPTPLENLLEKLTAVEEIISTLIEKNENLSVDEARTLSTEISDAREAWFKTLPEDNGKIAFGGAKIRVLSYADRLVNNRYDVVEGVILAALFNAETNGAMQESYNEAIQRFNNYKSSDAQKRFKLTNAI